MFKVLKTPLSSSADQVTLSTNVMYSWLLLVNQLPIFIGADADNRWVPIILGLCYSLCRGYVIPEFW